MTAYYDVALLIPADKTLAEVFDILGALDELEVMIDYTSIEFGKDKMSFEALHPDRLSPEQLESSGVKIDWDTMSEWDIEEEERNVHLQMPVMRTQRMAAPG